MRNFERDFERARRRGERMHRLVSVGIVVIFAVTLLGIGGVVWAILNPEMVAGRLGAAVKAFLEAVQ